MDTDSQAQFDAAAMAILEGNTTELERICMADPGVAHYRSDVGHPTLLQMVACEEPHVPDPVAAVQVLLAAGSETTGPLISAAGCNADKVVAALLDHGVGIDTESEWTPLDEALYWNNAAMALMLTDRGADLGRLRRAAGLGDVERCESFFAGPTLDTSAGPIRGPFTDTYADAQADDPALVIDHAFVMAANCGGTETAAFLLDRGARINVPPPGYHWRGTALHAAIWHGHAETVQWLLDNGADTSIRDGLADSDAIGWARHHNHPAIVDLLST